MSFRKAKVWHDDFSGKPEYEIMQTAWRERNPGARIKAAKEAIGLNPECATAYILLAEEEVPADILDPSLSEMAFKIQGSACFLLPTVCELSVLFLSRRWTLPRRRQSSERRSGLRKRTTDDLSSFNTKMRSWNPSIGVTPML